MIVWRVTGMVGSAIEFALYPDGRAFFPAPHTNGRRYVMMQLTPLEREAFITKIPLGALGEVGSQRVIPDVTDLIFDTVTIRDAAGTHILSAYGASTWYMNRDQKEWKRLGWHTDAEAVAALQPFWRLLDAVASLRPRATTRWVPSEVQVELNPYFPRDGEANPKLTPWPADIVEIDVKHPCDWWKHTTGVVPESRTWVEGGVASQLEPIVEGHEGPFSIQECPYRVRLYSPLPGEAHWRGRK